MCCKDNTFSLIIQTILNIFINKKTNSKIIMFIYNITTANIS